MTHILDTVWYLSLWLFILPGDVVVANDCVDCDVLCWVVVGGFVVGFLVVGGFVVCFLVVGGFVVGFFVVTTCFVVCGWVVTSCVVVSVGIGFGFWVAGSFGLSPIIIAHMPMGGLSESYVTWNTKFIFEGRVVQLFLKMYHLPFGSFEYSVAAQFWKKEQIYQLSKNVVQRIS